MTPLQQNIIIAKFDGWVEEGNTGLWKNPNHKSNWLKFKTSEFNYDKIWDSLMSVTKKFKEAVNKFTAENEESVPKEHKKLYDDTVRLQFAIIDIDLVKACEILADAIEELNRINMVDDITKKF